MNSIAVFTYIHTHTHAPIYRIFTQKGQFFQLFAAFGLEILASTHTPIQRIFIPNGLNLFDQMYISRSDMLQRGRHINWLTFRSSNFFGPASSNFLNPGSSNFFIATSSKKKYEPRNVQNDKTPDRPTLIFYGSSNPLRGGGLSPFFGSRVGVCPHFLNAHKTEGSLISTIFHLIQWDNNYTGKNYSIFHQIEKNQSKSCTIFTKNSFLIYKYFFRYARRFQKYCFSDHLVQYLIIPNYSKILIKWVYFFYFIYFLSNFLANCSRLVAVSIFFADCS